MELIKEGYKQVAVIVYWIDGCKRTLTRVEAIRYIAANNPDQRILHSCMIGSTLRSFVNQIVSTERVQFHKRLILCDLYNDTFIFILHFYFQILTIFINTYGRMY